ncbi:glycoside hydrolase family 5 protein [Xylariaceae sp. FL0662B]|nr:glycoside hydrolase family 5 protein [Xylariaceae sp. FL0662B]
MSTSHYCRWLVSILSLAGVSASSNAPRAPWPNGPFVTSGRWMTDATGERVTYAGVNWPGSLETMIPEGLQYQSIESIASQIKDLGMNAIRLTYAIELVDQYYDNGEKDVTIQKAFTDALGQENGTEVYNKVIANNPSFSARTTRLQVYDAIAEECAKQEIYVHLDNHVSKSGWCCDPQDGNAWWGDKYFDVDKWTRGLSFMAEHGKSWTNLMSMSLRNELRPPLSNFTFASTSYNWENWYSNVKNGSNAIHAANEDVLIFLSGLDSDTNLSSVAEGTALTPGSATFSRDDFDSYADKLVLELHAYDNIFGAGPDNCTAVQDKLIGSGFSALTDGAKNQFPVVLTEFGLELNAEVERDPYISCLLDYISSQRAGWMIWQLGGSYYIRQGKPDADETWALLTHDWSTLRSSAFINDTLAPAATETLKVNESPDGSSNHASERSTSGIWSVLLSLFILVTFVNFWHVI